MRQRTKIVLLLCVVLLAGPGLAAAQTHGFLTQVLNTHVSDGMVDYPELCSDSRLPKYIDQLASTDPAQFPETNAELAFWINAYNAYTLKIICDNYPVESINDLHTGGLVLGSVIKRTVWHKKLVTINNELTSLDAIEHKIIRPRFQEPRIHFALVCAAKGCPPLRAEAYEADRIDQQLDDQARVFLAQPDKNHFDRKGRSANISPIFKWFKKDFGGGEEPVLRYITPFLPEGLAEDINTNIRSWRINYSDYDWSLNEQ